MNSVIEEVNAEELIDQILELKEQLTVNHKLLEEYINEGLARIDGNYKESMLNGVITVCIPSVEVLFFYEKNIPSNIVHLNFYDKRIFIGPLSEGAGTLIYPNGTRYVGNMKKSVFHGKGTLYNSNGTYIEGVWNHGILQGEALFFDDSPIRCTFDNGNLVLINKFE